MIRVIHQSFYKSVFASRVILDALNVGSKEPLLFLNKLLILLQLLLVHAVSYLLLDLLSIALSDERLQPLPVELLLYYGRLYHPIFHVTLLFLAAHVLL